MAIGGLTITEPRTKAVDFSFPYFETSVGYLAHVPRELTKAAALLRAYNTNVWLPIVAALIVSGPVMWFLAKKSPTSERRLSISKCYRTSFQIIMSLGQYELHISHRLLGQVISRDTFGQKDSGLNSSHP